MSKWSTPWEVGQQVAVYRLGDLRGNPPTVKLDSIAAVRASSVKLESGGVYTHGGREYGSRYSSYRLRRVDDPDVVKVLARQDFEALRDEVSRAVMATTQDDKHKLRNAFRVLRGDDELARVEARLGARACL